MASVTRDNVKKLISTIHTLNDSLPQDAVPLGTKQDFLWKTFTQVAGESNWQTFNRRFDLVFGEDCRNEEGRLLHLRRGPLGLDLVLKYLESAHMAEGMLFDLMAVKLERLINELKYIVYVLDTSRL